MLSSHSVLGRIECALLRLMLCSVSVLSGCRSVTRATVFIGLLIRQNGATLMGQLLRYCSHLLFHVRCLSLADVLRRLKISLSAYAAKEIQSAKTSCVEGSR